MSLLLQPSALDARRAAAAGPLEPLAASLAADLVALADGDVYIPEQKALLSREGGRCARDGMLLEFDPFEPHAHRCAVCGTVYRGEIHDRFWIYWYQLWLAERAVHAALLAALRVPVGPQPQAAERIVETILEGYIDRYHTYPNVDNVLGPTRLFFSTYLESIWLLQICMAVDLLGERAQHLADRVRDRIVEPSRALIAEYDEGASNRQVWNAVALLAAARLVGDDVGAERAVFGAWGIADHLATGLLSDGTWFEGENYHLFAHRGLWYGVMMAEPAGLELSPKLIARFQRGFSTPFVTALPDLTLPSRRDSQYAISLRQWRIAEHCELGYARCDDASLNGALARLYTPDIPRRDTGRQTSSADVERNMPATALSRADLSWRALLCARESLPSLEAVAPASAMLDAQGIAVFRRGSGQSYVALDFGHAGGGHGHPDRLNLLLADGATRWLDDFGTGSYVDPSLHWYRSTLAHNAPLINGVSQLSVHGRALAYDERGAAGWIAARADGIAPGVRIDRSVVVMDAYLIDEITWKADRSVTVDLPLHADIVPRIDHASSHAPLTGAAGAEDGFRFVHDAECQRVDRGSLVRGAAHHETLMLEMWTRCNRDTEWWRAVAPGAPGRGDHAFRVLRAAGESGAHRSILAWTREIVDVAIDDETNDITIFLVDGSTHVHRRAETGWQIQLTAGGARSSIDLGGLLSETELATPVEPNAPTDDTTSRDGGIQLGRVGEPTTIALGEANYRRSEQSWKDAGSPAGQLSLSWTGHSLVLEIDVSESDLTFASSDAVNAYDNEHADINGDSVQLYVVGDTGRAAWMLVPVANSRDVRVRPLEGWTDPAAITATWRPSGGGYRLVAEVRDMIPRAIDVIVNEKPRGRERRRGQLVLSGGAGDFIYLRGDRHDAARLLPVRLPDV